MLEVFQGQQDKLDEQSRRLCSLAAEVEQQLVCWASAVRHIEEAQGRALVCTL